MAKKSVLIIYTGGTIGMVADRRTGSLKAFDIGHILKNVPELGKMSVKLDSVSFAEVVDSSDIQPKHWIEIAELVYKNYNLYDGFVVLHGTDTMAYTASGVSFLLENLGKPVIFTGAQLPIGVLRTDARENLITSVELAAHSTNGKPTVPEVCVYFKNQLYRGNRSHKINSELFQAFNSVNYPVLAEAGVNLNFFDDAIAGQPILPIKLYKKLDSNIAILKIFPGLSADVVKAVTGIKGLKALILETYGSGNAPTEKWFVSAIKQAVNSGLIVLNVTQCYGGAVEQGKYETSRQLEEVGVVGGADLTTEAAVAKLMFLLGNYKNKGQVLEMLREPLRGELTL
jgi:L-asparaginase